MALTPVSIKHLQARNKALVEGPQKVLSSNFHPVHVKTQDACCGVMAGKLKSYQNCLSTVVIPTYCPPPPPPTPEQKQNAGALKEAMISALVQAPPITVVASPLWHPGLRGMRRRMSWQFIIVGGNNPSGGDYLFHAFRDPLFTSFPAATPWGNLGAAYLTINNAATPTPVLNFTIPSNSKAQIETLWFSASAMTAGSLLKWSVTRSGNVVTPDFWFFSDRSVPLEFPANGDDVIQVNCINPDANMAVSVRLSLDLWLMPAVTQTDSLYSTVSVGRSDPSVPPNCRS